VSSVFFYLFYSYLISYAKKLEIWFVLRGSQIRKTCTVYKESVYVWMKTFVNKRIWVLRHIAKRWAIWP